MDLQAIVNTTRREKSLSLRYAGLSALEVLRIEEIEVEIHDIDAELAMPLPIEWSVWLTQRRARLVNERNRIDQKPVIAPAILEQKMLTFDEWHPKDCWNQLRFERGHLERVEVALRIPQIFQLAGKKGEIGGRQALILLLYHVAFQRRLGDMEIFFGVCYTKISVIIETICTYLFGMFQRLMLGNMQYFATRSFAYRK